jgi:trans-aconitate methyltransferase
MVKLKWRILKMFGLERIAWNLEWAAGRWNYLDAVNPLSVEIVRKYSRNGAIVELGCGSGALAASVGSRFYKSYKGVDISNVAIKRARARRIDRSEFEIGTMESAPIGPADLIIIQEALFYLESKQQIGLLQKCLRYVAPQGKVYITVHDGAQYASLVDRVRQAGSVVEERRVKYGEDEFVHIVIDSHGCE